MLVFPLELGGPARQAADRGWLCLWVNLHLVMGRIRCAGALSLVRVHGKGLCTGCWRGAGEACCGRQLGRKALCGGLHSAVKEICLDQKTYMCTLCFHATLVRG